MNATDRTAGGAAPDPSEAAPSPPAERVDIAVIGAGAAGLMAATFAARHAPGRRVVALDGAARVGAKILVAGGGRCNVTHDRVLPGDYFGGSRHTVKRVLRTFGVPETIAFFKELGVELKREDTGKLFPVTDKARTVLDALLRALAEAGGELRADHRVAGVRSLSGGGFALETPRGPIEARMIVLATGGLALPRTGSDGGGYALARTLGHTVGPTTPALVPLVLPGGHWLTALSGTAADAELRLRGPGGKVLHREPGPVLLTHFGLSGPAVMNISRHWLAQRRRDQEATLEADFTGGLGFDRAEAVVLEAARAEPRGSVGRVLRRWTPQRLAEGLCREAAGVDPGTRLAQLGREARRAVVHAVTGLGLPVERDRGYAFAEVTAGGVPLSEIDPATMASRACPGLLLAGEVLDVDGRIGGYNFQWAWASGRLAGLSAALSLTATGPAAMG